MSDMSETNATKETNMTNETIATATSQAIPQAIYAIHTAKDTRFD